MKKIRHKIRNLAAFMGAAGLIGVSVVLAWPILTTPDGGGGPCGDVDSWTVERGPVGGPREVRGTLCGGKAEKIMPPQVKFYRPRITYLIPEGTVVEKGDVLARFDREGLALHIRDIEKQIELAEARRFSAEVELEILENCGNAPTRKARFDRDIARKELEKYTEGELPLETRKKRLRVEEAETEYRRAKRKNRHMPDLFDEGFVTLDRKREAKISLKTCGMALDRARSDLEVFLKFSSRMTLFRKTSALIKAEKDFETSESRVEKQLKGLEAKVLHEKAQLARMRKNLAECREDLEKLTLKAPAGGVVLYGDADEPDQQTWFREMFMHVGGELHFWWTMFTLPDTSRLQVKMKIDEADLPNFKVDMPVLVDIESAGLKDLPGKISRIPEVTAKQDWRADRTKKEFEVEVSLEEGKLPVKTGVSADVRILGGRLKEVIRVPLHAVRSVKSRRFVYRIEAGDEGERLVRTEIEIGKRGLLFAEVTSGLDPGDRVFLGVPPVALLKVEEALALSGDGGSETGKGEGDPGAKDRPAADPEAEAAPGSSRDEAK